MHLLASLQSGFADAPGGSARIYRRGTTTNATCYTDFKGAISTTTHGLDGRGRVRRYVNELVDVKVFDVAGNQVVETFTEGVNATAVEIIHSHVTGTDYDTGQVGLNKPSTHQLLLDKLYTSFGADDFKVLLGGVATNLQDALLSNIVDLKQFDAVGDDSTDDGAAIQNCVTTVVARGGGIILVPPGTYKVTAAITGVDKVFFLGAHSSVCKFKQYTDSATILSSTLGFGARGLTFTADTLKKATFLNIATAASVVSSFDSCSFLGASSVKFGSINVTGVAQFNGCSLTDVQFVAGAGGGQADVVIVAGGELKTNGVTAKPFKALSGAILRIRDMGVHTLGNSGSTVQYTDGASDGLVFWDGCKFHDAVSGDFGSLGPPILAFTGVGKLFEDNCYFGTNVRVTGNTAATSKIPVWSNWRDRGYIQSSGATGSATVDPGLYKYIYRVDSNVAFNWPQPQSTPFSGSFGVELVLIYKNISGGNVTPTFNAVYKASAPLIANNQACAWHLVYDATLACWVEVATSGAYNS